MKKNIIIGDKNGAIRIQNMDVEDVNALFSVLNKYNVKISLVSDKVKK